MAENIDAMIESKQLEVQSILKETREAETKLLAMRKEAEVKEKPFREEIKEIWADHDAFKKVVYAENRTRTGIKNQLGNEIRALENEKILLEYNGKPFEKSEHLRAYLVANDINMAGRKLVAIKKPLPNGIRLFRYFSGYYGASASDAWKIGYFATYGNKVIGYHWREKAEHRGDTTYNHAWLGTAILEYSTQLKPIKQDYHKKGLGYKEWLEELKMIEDPSEYPAVEMLSETNRKTIREI